MNERIVELRKALGLKQNAFADELGFSKSNIKSYEYGRRNPSDAFIKLICEKYGVNEIWLRTGDGDMFLPQDREAEVADIAVALAKGQDDFKIKLASIIANFSEEQLERAKEIVVELHNEMEKDAPE